MLHKLIALLPKKLAKHGLKRPVLAAQVVSAWSEIVKQVCKKAAKACEAVSLSSTNVLTIQCQHATVAGELALCEEDILQYYAQQFPGLQIKLRFRTGARVSREADKLAP